MHEEINVTVPAGATYSVSQVLSGLSRTMLLAPQFQEYKFTSVKLQIRPKWDTFPVDLTTAMTQLPYLFYIQDPANALSQTLAYSDYLALGCKPVRVDAKTIVRNMSPTVILNTPNIATPGAVYPAILKKSPWLATAAKPTTGGTWLPNDVEHHGARLYIAPASTADTTSYQVTISVVTMFRKPNLVPSA